MKYIYAVKKAGGIPLVIPTGTEQLAEDWITICDGIILSSGEDIDPFSYHQEPSPKMQQTNAKRDVLEMALVQLAIKNHKPILGICRGITMLNVALGGTLYQDIETNIPGALNHYQKAERPEPTHSINVNKNSWLYKVLNSSCLRVNSFHHQAINQLASSLKKVAESPDGVIEAVESNKDNQIMIGIQWHPEEMASENKWMQHLFDEFINECSRRKER
jgi:putative glutamine amidotransferase